MLSIRTAEEMYQYCKANDLGIGTSKGWAIKHFQLLINNLSPGEEVYCVFIGLHNSRGISKHDGNYAYAITNKRILMVQNKLIGAVVQSVNIENLNDITLSKTGIGRFGLGTVCFDTTKEAFNVQVNVSSAGNIYNRAYEAWQYIKSQKNSTQIPRMTTPGSKSPVDQIKEYKELLDMGILTQEEFDAKKKELLGI